MATGQILFLTEKEIKFNHRKILPGNVTYCNTGRTRINEKFSECIQFSTLYNRPTCGNECNNAT